MRPLVSILISAYNAGRWIEQTVDSALAQTYPNLEVIVVNDGSTDNTLDILNRYAEAGRIKLISQKNAGPCAAGNASFTASHGEFIKYMDADDLISRDAVESQVAALSSRPRHIAHGRWGRFTNDPSTAQFIPHPGWHDGEPFPWIMETLADTEPMYQVGMFLIPRVLMEEVGGWDERLLLFNDFEFFVRLILASDGIVFTPECRLYYRSNITNSISTLRTRRASASAALGTELVVGHLLGHSDTPRVRALCADLYQVLVYYFYPDHPDIWKDLLTKADKLGGSKRRPQGGKGFLILSRLLGWRLALRYRALAKGMKTD